MDKYRIKLLTGRVIGPFSEHQICELFVKEKITTEEDFQKFPAGDWLPIDKFSQLHSSLKKSKENQTQDPTFIKKLSDFNLSVQDKTEVDRSMNTAQMQFPKEFSFELEESRPQEVIEEAVAEKNFVDQVEELVEKNKTEQKEEGVEKTRIVTKLQDLKAPLEEDKTQINPDTIKYLEELKKEKEKEEEAKKLKEETEKEKIPEVDLDVDSTQFFDLKSLNTQIKEEIENVELELEDEKKEIEEEKKVIKRAKTKEDNKESKEDNEEEELKKKKKKKLIMIIACLVLIFIFLDEEEAPKVQKISLRDSQIYFPQRYDIPSEPKAIEFYKKGNEFFETGVYTKRVKAGELFRNSVENQFKDNKALARLIYTYSSLLENANNFEESASKIFKLVQLTITKSSRDPLYAAGIANFYYSVGKYEASVLTIEKFNILKVNNPTTELYSVYLKALMKTGDMVKALEVAKKLSAVKNKSYDVYLSLYEYYFIRGEYDDASKIVVEALGKFPNNVGLLIKKCDLLIYKEDFEGLKKVLGIMFKLNLEGSKIYYSKYHEFKALYYVSKNKVNEAVKAFEEALKLNESIELRSKLALLDQSSNSGANRLITESKAIKLIQNSTEHMKKNNWKFAFKDALEATRVASHYLPAQLHLTKLQIKQGFFAEALQTLNELFKQNPLEPNIAFALVDAYIESYKFGSAKKILEAIGSGALRADPRYYSVTAKFYIYKDDYQSSIAWLTSAINRNPIDDHNTYELAKVFIKNRKYNKAKILLGKAQDLNPVNLDYRVSFSDILYEMDGADSAIGYLYSVLKDFPDNAKILSTIGIYYYRSGQIKMFKSIKEKVLALPNKTTALFEFLIHAAKMEENTESVINYSKELIDINPGDLRARLFLAKVYIELYKYKAAFRELEAIQDRLETYPKLQYYMSKLYLLTDNIKKAQELSEKEIKSNPNSIDGYILMAEINIKQKKFSEAEKFYKKAQRIDTKNVEVLMGLAYINFKKSQFEISLDLYKKARRYDPSNVEVHRELGDVYRKVGQSALAIESYQVYLELFPNSKHKQTLESYIGMMR